MQTKLKLDRILYYFYNFSTGLSSKIYLQKSKSHLALQDWLWLQTLARSWNLDKANYSE